MEHLPEYLVEGWGLGMFMCSAGIFATVLYTNIFAIPQVLPDPTLRDILMGVAMGTTAVLLIYSPWGKRSGAHLNPAVTLTFFRLKKLSAADAFFYSLFQLIGGIGGITIVSQVLGNFFTKAPPAGVNYIVTVPNKSDWLGALIAEFLIAYTMMTMVLWVSNNPKINHFTGLFSGCLVALFVIFAAPFSGFSMNPARSFASALLANTWDFFWIYYFVPPLTMLFAAEVYLHTSQMSTGKLCGKLCPNNSTPCLCKNPCDVCCPHQDIEN